MDRGRRKRDLLEVGGRPVKLFVSALTLFLAWPTHPGVFASGDDGPAVLSAPDAGEASSQPSSIRDDQRMRRWRRTMLLGLLLLVVLAVASVAIIRFSRNYRRYLLKDPRTPTPSDDVWKMHKLPEEEGSAPPDDDGGWGDSYGDESDFDSPDRR